MEILISTEWLASHIHDVTILDASAHLPDAGRDPLAEYLDSRIPAARFLGLPSLKDDASPVPSALPTAEQFAARMTELGVTYEDCIVLYDSSMLRSSARAAFIFDLYGFENIAVLDGGFAKWVAEGRPVGSGNEAITPSDFVVKYFNGSLVRTKQDMLQNCETPAEQVVDARDAERFTGTSADMVHGLEGGHIPGACNLHFAKLFREDGTFKDIAGLRSTFEEAGIDLDLPVAASCGGGMTASVVLFAMRLQGKLGALYDGSWSEWGADPDTPKEIGVSKKMGGQN